MENSIFHPDYPTCERYSLSWRDHLNVMDVGAGNRHVEKCDLKFLFINNDSLTEELTKLRQSLQAFAELMYQEGHYGTMI